MKVMVTGGNGFIGRHVVRELMSHGISVISFDSTPPKDSLDSVEYVLGTVLDPFIMSDYLKGCDAVLHLAAILGVQRCDKELLKCLTINIQGTANVLEACVMSRVPKVLVTSSSEVFGESNNAAKINEKSSFNPKSGYAISKLASEKYLEGFSKEYGLQYNIVRFFNIYGPNQIAEFVIPRFVMRIRKGLPPQIYGNGDQVRSFCHISDASRGLVDIFLNKDANNQIFNIGNDTEPIKIKDLARKIVNKAGSTLEPEYIPFSGSDRNDEREIYYRVPDISKIKEAINYEPKVTLDVGIQDMVESGEITESW